MSKIARSRIIFSFSHELFLRQYLVFNLKLLKKKIFRFNPWLHDLESFVRAAVVCCMLCVNRAKNRYCTDQQTHDMALLGDHCGRQQVSRRCHCHRIHYAVITSHGYLFVIAWGALKVVIFLVETPPALPLPPTLLRHNFLSWANVLNSIIDEICSERFH